MILKMTAWKDGFEVFDGPSMHSWLGHEWLVQFGVVGEQICKVCLTLPVNKGQENKLQTVATAIQGQLGEPDPQLSLPQDGAVLWHGNDGTVILQFPRGVIVIYFTSMLAIRDAVSHL